MLLYQQLIRTFLNIFLGVLRMSEEEQPTVKAEKSSSTGDVVAVGDVAAGVLKRVPLSLAVNLESVEAVANLDRRAKWASYSIVEFFHKLW